MIDTILRALKALDIDTWILRDTATQSAELFYIRQKEDMRRAKDVHTVSVTVYQDFEEDGQRMRGGSGTFLFPGMSAEEIARKLENAKHAARHVKNPWFELCDPVAEDKPYQGGMRADALQAAEMMADALFAPDTGDAAFINSAEIFSERKQTRILSSRGADIRFETRAVRGEFVVQCVTPVDVEMYYDFEYALPDTAAMTELARQALISVRDRALASRAPASGNYDLLLSERHVYTLLSAYLEKADAAMIYARYSPYAIGMNVQGESIPGEKLDITVVPNDPFSEDGIPMPERALIRQGKLVSIIGGTRFCRYLNIAPTGFYEYMRVENGTRPFDDLKRAPCLWPVAFSDFQMDAMTGHFGGEIRLAYLIDENGVTPVTGGSVNGSLLDRQGQLVFSVERYRDSRYDGPRAVRIPDVSVAG